MPKIIKSSKLGDAAILKQIINILKKGKNSNCEIRQIYTWNKFA